MPFLVVSLVWFATSAGWFDLPQGILYDTAVRMTPPRGDAGQELLMIEADSGENYDDREIWSETVAILQESGAGQILFMFMPRDATPAFYEEAARAGNIRFGRRVLPGPEKKLESIPPAGRGIPFATGVLSHPVSTYGIYREHQGNVSVGGQSLPSLALEAARAVQGPEFVPMQDPFLINFIDRPALLPGVSLEQLLSGALLPEMIRDRSVLIGFGPDPGYPGLQTSLKQAGGTLSFFEFEGYVLDTLLRSGPVIRPRGIEVPGCLAVLGLAAFFIFLRLPLALGLGSMMLMLAAAGAGTWACAVLFQVWLPLAQAWTVIVLTFMQVVMSRNIREDRLVRRMLLERSGRLKKVLLPLESDSREIPWSGIMTLVDQALNVNRSIFLERIPGQNRVREVAALRCSINDLEERRRDIERSPYTTALEEGGPVRLVDRLVLVPGDVSGMQYLVPLRDAGHVLGFWALDLEERGIRSQPELLGLIRDFAEEIGDLLAYHRNGKAEREQARLRRFVGGGKRGGGLVRINRDLHMLEKRLLLMDGVFQSMGTATILYDLFGRVVQVNESMAGLLRQADLPPFSMSGLDLAARLSGRPLEEIRVLLADTIVSGGTHTLSVSLPILGKHSMLLSFRALKVEESAGQTDITPFSVRGILFEVVNASAIRDAEEIRRRFVEEAVTYLQQGVESFEDACTLVESGEAVSPLADMKSRKEGMLALLERFRRFSETDLLDSVSGRYPVDPVAVLETVWETFAGEAGDRKVSLERPDRKGELVMAAPGGLESCLRSVFAYLLGDCVRGSRIVVQLRESHTASVLDILGTGFGMPGEEFDRLFSDRSLPASPEFGRVRDAADEAGRWGGELTGSSELGKGTAFRLRMPRFMPFAAGGEQE